MMTNGAANARLPIISDMLKAIERIKAEGPMPPKEIRIHPDDYEELKRQIKTSSIHFPVAGSLSTFSGINIVVDLAAERLPRKQSKSVPVAACG